MKGKFHGEGKNKFRGEEVSREVMRGVKIYGGRGGGLHLRGEKMQLG